MAEQQIGSQARLAQVSPDGYGYIRSHYGVPVHIGQRIDMNGKAGTVMAPTSTGPYVWIQFTGYEAPVPARPAWETVYYNEDGSIAADYRKQPQEATA